MQSHLPAEETYTHDCIYIPSGIKFPCTNDSIPLYLHPHIILNCNVFSYGYDETMLFLKIYLYSNIFLSRPYKFDILKSIHRGFSTILLFILYFYLNLFGKNFNLKSLETNLCLFIDIYQKTTIFKQFQSFCVIANIKESMYIPYFISTYKYE